MAKNTKKRRRIEEENRNFQEQWTDKYCFIEYKKKIICLICEKIIGVPKEYNLNRHYQMKHKDFNEKFKGELRKQKIASLIKSLSARQTFFIKSSDISKAVTEVSYDISQLIAKTSRPFTDGDFVKKCLITASQKLSCVNCVKNFELVNLSRMTVQRRITDIADNIASKFSEISTKFVYFSLAADESTDITSTAQMSIFARGVTPDFEIHEELVSLHSMNGQTRGSDLLQGILQSTTKMNLDLSKLCGITTDGAPAMIGANNGMVFLLEKHLRELGHENSLIKYHCIIHQQNLVGKELGFENVMATVVHTVNYIKSKGLNHRQFKTFLNEIDAEYKDLLYYCEVRWLSRGKVLTRFMLLLNEIKLFLVNKGKSIDVFEDPQWLCDLAFLTDITTHLNDLNLRLQGKNHYISDMANNISAFQEKLKLFHLQLNENKLSHFPQCKEMFSLHGIHSSQKYASHIIRIQESFQRRFCDFNRDRYLFKTFANPFSVSINEADSSLQLELIDLQNNDQLKSKYQEGDLQSFYKYLPEEKFPNLRKKAALCASLFGSTYICELAFSKLKLNKSQHRNRLNNDNVGAVLRIATTNIEPDIEMLVASIQCQKPL